MRAFLDRWGFNDNDTQPDDADLSEDLNPWNNPRRWKRGPTQDRVDNAKDRFTWWLLGKWLGFAGGGAAIVFPWLLFSYRASSKLRSPDSKGCPANELPSRRRSPRRPRKPAGKRRETTRT